MLPGGGEKFSWALEPRNWPLPPAKRSPRARGSGCYARLRVGAIEPDAGQAAEGCGG